MIEHTLAVFICDQSLEAAWCWYIVSLEFLKTIGFFFLIIIFLPDEESYNFCI